MIYYLPTENKIFLRWFSIHSSFWNLMKFQIKISILKSEKWYLGKNDKNENVVLKETEARWHTGSSSSVSHREDPGSRDGLSNWWNKHSSVWVWLTFRRYFPNLFSLDFQEIFNFFPFLTPQIYGLIEPKSLADVFFYYY